MKTTLKSYQGPAELVLDMAAALARLDRLVTVEIGELANHSVVQVKGLDSREEVVEGIAVYLVGAIAGCIEFNLQIRAALFNEKRLSRDLLRDVVQIVGATNSIEENVKIYDRDPWLWEGISHLLFHLSLTDPAKHPPAPLIAKSSLHLSAKDHGLDIVALYGVDSLGVSAAECKAYLQRPSDAIADAANRLREIDHELRDSEIRSVLVQLRPSLSSSQQTKLASAFWYQERAYFPMVCCDAKYGVDWTEDRIVLSRLVPPANRKHLVPASIDDARRFFDAVADAMRSYAAGKPFGAQGSV